MRLFIEGNLLSLRDIAHFLARGSWIHILAAVILGLLILIGVFSLAGLSEIARIMSNVNPGYIALACAAILITFVLRTWRWSVMLRTSGHRIHADTGFKCITFGWLANYILPLRIGDLMRGVALKTTENTPLSVGLSTVAVERAMDMLTLAVLLAGAIFVVSGSAVAYDLAFAALLIAVCLLAAMALVYRYDHVLFRVFGSRLDRYRGSLMAFKKGMEGLYGNPQAIALCVLLSFPIWGLELASIFLSARAIGVNLSPGLSTLAGISAFIMQSVPTTPAGIGVHEGTIAGILMLFGISADIGTSIALLDHLARGLVIFVFGTISGIHIGFESRKYFAQGKGVVRKGVANDEYSPELSAPALQIAEK